MIHHRHSKGKVLDLNSEVCPNSFLDGSTVGEGADVYKSHLRRTWTDYSRIIKVNAEDSDLRDSEIYSSSVESSTIVGSRIYDSNVLFSNLTEVQARGSVIYGCTIDADVQIGQAELVGLTINKPMRIGVGFWDRVPRSFEIDTDLASFVVTESTEQCVYVGCQRKPAATWLKGASRYQKIMGWPDEIIVTIRQHLEEWLDNPI